MEVIKLQTSLFMLIKNANKERILKCNTLVPERSGIYILTRYESGFKFAYVGQAKNILQRLTGPFKWLPTH